MTEATIVMPIEQIETDLVPYEDDGQDRLAHIVNPPNNPHIWRKGMTAQDIVDIARVTGEYVVALCGHRWVPKHDPDKYPVCQTCMDLAGKIISEDG